MSGDYSRRRFDPRRHYAGVHMQQGRVQLDADWNELVDIVERRVRVGTLDTIGRAAVPRETPNAFRIVTSPSGHTIGRGRMYVDGIVAENFGGSQASEFDPVTAEERLLPGSIPFVEQPFFVPGMDIGVPDVPYAVYLDVWGREVTAVEAPSLVESALGVDTTTRMQTVWQVRTMPVPAGLTKDTIAGSDAWKEATAPSAARLTTKSDPITPSAPDPCALVTGAGGYTGLENQLYRIEIHDGGNPGESSFKWSRDNASVAWRVLAIDGATVTLEATGRDANLRISIDDWVEITDDRRELGGSAGDFQQVVDVDDDKGTITLQNPVTGIVANRNARVRRWDGPLQTVRADGAFMDLEHGIRVKFWLDDAIEFGRYRAGEYWVFAARTSNASVEPLEVAPPAGPHHHYACLAIGTGAPGSPDDCRTLWPPEATGADGGGCCTVVCEPGDDIQTAIDSLADDRGGCVCLKAGAHEIDEPLLITKSNISIHGESMGARLVAKTDMAIVVTPSEQAADYVRQVSIVGLTIVGRGETMSGVLPMISVQEADGVSIRDCVFVKPKPDGAPSRASMAIFSRESVNVRIERNEFQYLSVAVIGRSTRHVAVTDNIVVGHPGVSFGVCGGDFGGPWAIERNWFRECLTAVYLDRSMNDSRVSENRISRTGAMLADGKVALNSHALSAFAIDIAGRESTVTGNDLNATVTLHGGIRVSGPHSLVAGNVMTSSVSPAPTLPLAIVAGADDSWGDKMAPIAFPDGGWSAAHAPAADHVRIEGNTLLGPVSGITVGGRVSTQSPMVVGNVLTADAASVPGGIGISLYPSSGPTIADNDISGFEIGIEVSDGRNARIAANRVSGGSIGITFTEGAWGVIERNLVHGAGTMGIYAVGAGEMRLLANTVSHCGFAKAPAAGLKVEISAGALTVDGCDFENIGVAPDGKTAHGGATYAMVLLDVDACSIRNTSVRLSAGAPVDPRLQHRALAVEPTTGATVEITACVFQGRSPSGLVQLDDTLFEKSGTLFSRAIIANNRCEHTGGDPGHPDDATLRIAAHTTLLTGNYIQAANGLASVSLRSEKGNATAVGNITQTDWSIDPGMTMRPADLATANIFGA